jgi:hypothetical protein
MATTCSESGRRTLRCSPVQESFLVSPRKACLCHVTIAMAKCHEQNRRIWVAIE